MSAPKAPITAAQSEAKKRKKGKGEAVESKAPESPQTEEAKDAVNGEANGENPYVRELGK